MFNLLRGGEGERGGLRGFQEVPSTLPLPNGYLLTKLSSDSTCKQITHETGKLSDPIKSSPVPCALTRNWGPHLRNLKPQISTQKTGTTFSVRKKPETNKKCAGNWRPILGNSLFLCGDVVTVCGCGECGMPQILKMRPPQDCALTCRTRFHMEHASLSGVIMSSILYSIPYTPAKILLGRTQQALRKSATTPTHLKTDLF